MRGGAPPPVEMLAHTIGVAERLKQLWVGKGQAPAA